MDTLPLPGLWMLAGRVCREPHRTRRRERHGWPI